MPAYKSSSIILIALIATIVTTSCKNTTKPKSATQEVIDNKSLHEPQSDGSYERFMDSMLSRKNIAYNTTPIEGYEVWLSADQEGYYLKQPKTYVFDDIEFNMEKMQIVNEEGDRLFTVEYETDTAFIFHFKGKKYGWAETHFRMCNGMWCLEQYYLLADFQHRKLFVFRTMAVPTYSFYFGDVNDDDNLDFLIPDNHYPDSPYHDTTMQLTLTAYTYNKNGKVEAIKDKGKDCIIEAEFDNGIFAPSNFHVLERNCPVFKHK